MIIVIVFLFAIIMISSVPFVYAGGGPEWDYDERFEDIPGAPECWHDGYIDRRDNPFDYDRNEECRDKGNQYYRAFIHGCKSVEGNTEGICVSTTDR